MIVDGTASGGPEQSYTRTEIIEVLGRTLLDHNVFLAELDSYTYERESAKQEAAITDDVVRLAVVYERVEGDGANDSNIEGWYEDLETQSDSVLQSLADRQELGERDLLARNLAALLHVALRRQTGSSPDVAFLQSAGLNLEPMIERFQGVLVEAAISQGADAAGLEEIAKRQYPTLSSIRSEHVPLIWEKLISPLAATLRVNLQAAGHDLPELDERGEYPGDDEGE
jgi:hypothetical protein